VRRAGGGEEEVVGVFCGNIISIDFRQFFGNGWEEGEL